MYHLKFTKSFQKDVKLCKKQGKDLIKLKTIFDILISGETIPPQYKNHPLKGNLVGYYDLHIEPDWILIYKIENESIILLISCGSHSKLFK